MKTLHKIILWLAVLCLSGCAGLSSNRLLTDRAGQSVRALPSQHRQAVIVLPDNIKPQRAIVFTLAKKDGEWAQEFPSMSAVIGRNGLAAPGDKREGDGRTPSGIFEIKRAFGYAPRVKTGLDYRQATADDFWIDDPASAQYNQWVTGTPQAASFEVLRRNDKLYKYAAVIEYNTSPVVPGHGSAIFLHIWRGRGQPTAGCVAVSPRNMKKLLKWLDLSANPVMILNDE